MNWIISKSEKIEFHTNLSAVLKPIEKFLEDYQFFVSDYLFKSESNNLPFQNFSSNYEILSAEDFKKILQGEVQFMWLYLAAVPKGEQILIDDENLPYVEGNPDIWEAGFQMGNAVFELYAYDSSYTILKFKNQEHSELFKDYFREAERLEEYQF